MTVSGTHPFSHVKESLSSSLSYFSLPKLDAERVAKLPYSIRVLLEAVVRNCDGLAITADAVSTVLEWPTTSQQDKEVPFTPARVLMQDFTGVPAIVDLAAMRDAMARLGGDPAKINPLVPVDLVIDHSVQVDVARTADAAEENARLEFARNEERFRFLKWGSTAFDDLTIVPPGSGIVHQVNLEYLARCVFFRNGLAYPDTLVGTDSHTTMINGLGILGWGVGGIEAEAAMLGQPQAMVLPKVVGVKLTGKLPSIATATDLVLTLVAMLRKHGVVGKFVEFYGPGAMQLTTADRATIANMAPEYGATCGFFPVDAVTLDYLRQTGRPTETVQLIEQYLRANMLFVAEGQVDAQIHYSEHMELDLATIVSCVAGPKRPHDLVKVANMPADFASCLTAKLGFKGFAIAPEAVTKKAAFEFQGEQFELAHGDVVIAAITSCTNTSNPAVMIGAGLLAKKAVEKGLSIKPYIKTSLSPGSGVVTQYLKHSGLQQYLDALGFNTVGYGCMTCIGNSGDLPEPVSKAITEGDVVAAAVLSGNRNFEARVHPLTRANYLASPPLVVAYALAGNCSLDFAKQPLGVDSTGNPVFLSEIWPTAEEIQQVISSSVLATMFSEVYASIKNGTPRWNALQVPPGTRFAWDADSTYIHNPPFFATMKVEPPVAYDANAEILGAYCLLNLGDSITTDHISPAGNIAKTSPAARFLQSRGVAPTDFNSYGARRGNDIVMQMGTYANTRLLNKLNGASVYGPKTVHVPSNESLDIYDASQRYISEGKPLVVLAGAEYGSGSSRDWAAKGPYLLGIKAVVAVSYERIHRANLVGMGIVPLQFKNGQSADSLGLTGRETFDVIVPAPKDLRPFMDVTVRVSTGVEFVTTLRFDTPIECEYFRHGGILHYVLRNLLVNKA
eukprot:ANDGO_08323.mRNA.1 Putative aconitate hydratase